MLSVAHWLGVNLVVSWGQRVYITTAGIVTI